MHIGLIIYGGLDTLSGGYLYDRKLVDQLRQGGDHVEIISLPWRNYARHLGDNLHRQALIDRCRSLNLDLLLQDELNHPSLAWSNSQLRAQLGIPLVSIVHHLRADETHPAWLTPLYRSVESRYVNSVDGFIFNSHSTCRAVTRLLTRPRASIVAYPAADHMGPPTATKVAGLVKQRSQEPGPLRALAEGNVIERKNLHTLIDALARLPNETWSLTIAGSLSVDPAYVRRLQRQITSADLGLSLNDEARTHVRQPGYVHFTDAVDTEKLRQLYAASHVMALPSYEGFGIVYLEAMAYGVIPVASTLGAAGEIIDDGVDGYLVDPGNADELARRLQRLHENRKRLTQMGLAARRRFDTHPTWDESMGSVCQWLHEFVQERQP